MPLWKDGAFVDDVWRTLGAAEPAPGEGAVVVPFDRWKAEAGFWRGRNAPTGVVISPSAAPSLALGAAEGDLEADLQAVALIALEFPKFSDGRAYSLAQRLRQKTRFAGELRAVGDVLLDQLQLMRRCGFDAFEIVHPATIAALARGHVAGITHFYQPGLSPHEAPAGTRPWLRTGDRS